MMPLGRCGTGVPLDQLHPDDAAEVERFRAYVKDVAAGVADGMDRDAARDAALAAHYPDDYARLVRAEDGATPDLQPWETGGDPLGEDAGNP